MLENVIIGEIYEEGGEINVNLLTIYDKSDTATISDKELKELMNRLPEI